jgi:hypothetical protein
MSYRNLDTAERSRLPRLAAIGLAAGRLAIGAGIWLAPRRSWKALGFEDHQPQGPALVLGRLAASRDLALGAWTLAALQDPERLRRVVATVAVVDGADSLAFALALREGPELRQAAIRGLVAAIPATLVGAWAASRFRAP